MLSVRCRDEMGKGLGFGDMDDNELEEGEALSGQEDNEFFDPDIALSYIDEKLQDVLGHFQKDFEGGVTAENLGSKFGGYGSFLPSYQRSPSVLTQSKTPPRPANHTISRSPCSSSVYEAVRSIPPIATDVSITRNITTSTAQVSNSGTGTTTQPNKWIRKENAVSSRAAETCVSQNGSNKPLNSSVQNSLKVRLKVGPENSFARDKAAIYCGLGLDDSPGSSHEESAESNGQLSPEFQDTSGESPVTILQVMTSYSVPGGYLLSPLHDHLLHLSEKERCLIRTSDSARRSFPEITSADYSSLPTKKLKIYSDKKVDSSEKNGKLMELEDLDCKGVTNKLLEKEIDIETPAGQKLLSNALNIPILSSVRDPDVNNKKITVADSVKITNKMSVVTGVRGRTSIKDSNDIPNGDQFSTSGSLRSPGLGNTENEPAKFTRKSKSDINFTDKILERRSLGNKKEPSLDLLSENKIRPVKSGAISKFDSDGSNAKDTVAVHARPIKKIPSQKANSHGKYESKLFQDLDQAHDVKDKQKVTHSNYVPSVEPSKEIRKASASVVSKEKKSFPATNDRSEKKHKLFKSRKEMSRREHASTTHEKQVDKRADLLEPYLFTEEPKEKSGKNDHAGISEHLPIAPSGETAPLTNAAATLHAPVLIKENWVQCDKCQKWRLLPYGTDPDNLPKKWKCSMQLWLPGLNKCRVSEEETQKAFNDLYMVPAPGIGASLDGQHGVALPSITSADALNIDQRHVPTKGAVPNEEKYGVVDANLPNYYSPSKKNLQGFIRNKRLNDAKEYPWDSNSLPKAAVCVDNNPSDFLIENHSDRRKKEQHQVPLSDGGNSMTKSGKHSKTKSKREDQDGVRASKKIKKEAADLLVEDGHSDLEGAYKAVPVMDNGLFNTSNEKRVQNCGDPSKNSKREVGEKLSISVKKPKNSAHDLSGGESKEQNVLVVKKSGALIAAKKRKLEERQETSGHQENVTTNKNLIPKEATHECEMRKQKKVKLPKTEERKPKNDLLTKTILSDGRDCPSAQVVEDDRIAARKDPVGHYQEKVPPRRALDGTNARKINVRVPAVTTSSSSKVSSSRKSRANLQEVKGSPVGSVSSSPLRIPNKEKTSRSYVSKDDVADVGLCFAGSPKRCSDGEADGGSDQSETLRKGSSSVQQKSLDNQEKEANNLYGGKAKEVLHSRERNKSSNTDADKIKLKIKDYVGDKHNLCPDKNVTHCHSKADLNYDQNSAYQDNIEDEYYNFEEKDEHHLRKENSSAKSTHADIRGNSSYKTIEDNIEGGNKDVSSVVTLAGSNCKTNFQENPQRASHQSQRLSKNPDFMDRSEMSLGRGISRCAQPSKHEYEAHCLGSQTVIAPSKGNKSEIQPVDIVNNTRKLDNQNGDHAHSLRQATLDGQNSATPMRKDGPAAAQVLREARDLKHTANRLKQEGLDHESINIYFESALKFLHYSSLLEVSSADGAGHGDLKQMMIMYAETAKLCMYCAHEYERCKDMAAAALAYKCVEVAYFKAAYYKNPGASKDRNELQAVLQTTIPGESPSSSASDVDNLNNHGSLDKAVLTKATGSPQLAGNCVISARNRHNFIGLLGYTNDLNCAFEATKRAQSAISAASVNLDKVSISSVRKVLDFSYHNVEGFLRLVRLSSVSISR